MRKTSSQTREFKKYSTIFKGLQIGTDFGLTTSIPIILGITVGIFLDSKLNSKPVFIIAFTILGISAGIYGGTKIIKEFLQESRQIKIINNKH